MPYTDSVTLSETAQIVCLLLEFREFAPRALADATSLVLGRPVARVEPYVQACRKAGADIRTEREGRTSWYRLVRPPRYTDEVLDTWSTRCEQVASALASPQEGVHREHPHGDAPPPGNRVIRRPSPWRR